MVFLIYKTHLKALKKHLDNDVEFIGIFDKSLGNPNYDISQMAVMGFVDIIKKIVNTVLTKNGGEGAIREMIDMIIDKNGQNEEFKKLWY